MQARKFFHGLRFRVAAGVLLPLLIILTIVSYARHVAYQELLMGNLHAAAENAGRIIESSLQHAMLTNDFSTLGKIVDDIGQRADVQAIYLLSKPGEVINSTDNNTIGEILNQDDPTCQACHQYEAISRNENVILELDGGRVFRNVNAIENTSECFECHGDSASTLGVLITDFDVGPIERTLAADRRNSLLWLAGSLVLVVTTVYVLMDRAVIARIGQLAKAIRRVGEGDLNVQVPTQSRDELGDLGRVFDQMIDGLRERDRLENSLRVQTKELQAHTRRLAILNALADTLSQSLDLRETLDNALARVVELMDLRASWVVLAHRQDEGFELAASQGLPRETALSHMACPWHRCVCTEIMESGQVRVIHDISTHTCPAGEYLRQQGLVSRACVPLKARDRILGVMSLLGDASSNGFAMEDNVQDTLLAIGRQIGIAIENAVLYQELQREETLRRHLLERVMAVQEEERKRIAL
jgi:HAMP domain-containing protein